MGKNPNVGTIPSPPPSKEQTRFRKCSDPNCARPSPRIVSPSCHSNSNECKQRWCCFFFPWGRKTMHLKQSINQSFVWAVYRFHNSKCVSCSSVFVDVTFLFYICFGSTGLSKKGCLPNCLKARLGIMGPSTTIDCDLSSSAMALIMGNAAWSLSRGWLGSIGDDEMLLSCIGIIISQYKDPH